MNLDYPTDGFIGEILGKLTVLGLYIFIIYASFRIRDLFMECV